MLFPAKVDHSVSIYCSIIRLYPSRGDKERRKKLIGKRTKETVRRKRKKETFKWGKGTVVAMILAPPAELKTRY